jgi:uncharacterized protein YggE
MNRFALAVALSSITFFSFAQTEKNPPAVQVLGISKKMVTPDVAILSIMLTYKDMNFAQTTVGLNAKTKDVSRQIVSAGFKEADIKTTDYNIRVNRIYRNDSYLDSGYVASQNVVVEFNYSKEKISKILTTFSKSKTPFELRFDFKLSDELKKKVNNDLIRLAVNDAKEKARILSESSGVKLKRILDIQYGLGFNEYAPREAMYSMNAKLASEADVIEGFTPKEVELNDHVTMRWEIE